MTGPLSFMIGMRPNGLTEFVQAARPAGLYCLNNRVAYPGVLTVFRVQNDTWDRLPDACGVDRYFETQDPIASAEYELFGKTLYVPGRGNLNLIEYWKLSDETWYAPYNEWALDQGSDSYKKADWMNAWTCRALEIAHGYGLKLCIGSFATGNPDFALLPRLYPMLRLAKLYGGILDLHEYGVEGPLMSSPSSGALRYRELNRVLPAEAQIPIVISEFWWGNGFVATDDVAAQIADAEQYGRELVKDPMVLWASAFQLDEGAESSFTMEAREQYTLVAAGIQSSGGSSAKGGLHLRADPLDHNADEFPLEIAALQAAHLKRAAIKTSDTFESYDALIASGILAVNCVMHMGAAGDNPSLGNPAQFFNEQYAWLQRFYQRGGRYVEIHNEPNIADEGYGTFWNSPEAFGGFYDSVARLIRGDFPEMLIGWPGLAPRDDYAAWLPVIRASIVSGTCDWVGAHAYWDSAANMNSDAQGRAYRRFRGLGKPVIVTECSNNIAGDSDYDKGRQYGAYFLTLEADVLSAFVFVSSATDPTFNARRETWIRNGALTQIPEGVLDPLPVTPVEEWEFYYWTVDGARVDGAPLTLTMDRDHEVTPHARKKVLTHSLTMNPCPEFAGLAVSIEPPGGVYADGTIVTCTPSV